MGTVLSISPSTKKKASIMDSEIATRDGIKSDKRLKRPSMFVSLSWKKLVASSAKKSAKKVTPNPPLPASELPPASNNQNQNQVAQLNSENIRKTEEKKPKVPIPVPVPTVPEAAVQNRRTPPPPPQVQEQPPNSQDPLSPSRIVVQASTGELLRCLGDFMCRRCLKVKPLNSGEVVLWFRNVDRTLLIQGWQDQGFITPANVVFVYLLCEDAVQESISTADELQGTFQTCLYLAYSYMGSEISYPIKPFMMETNNQDVFFENSLRMVNRMSGKMLQLNADPQFFTEVFQDLKNYGEGGSSEPNLDR